MAVADRPQTRGGFALGPSDHDLITFVLHPMVARQQGQGFDGVDFTFVHLADVYSVDPERLTERYAPAPATNGGDRTWYFICPVRCRYTAAAGALGEGRWSSETGKVVSPVCGADGRRVSYSRTLSYSYGGASRTTTTMPWTTVTRHGWCMVELALDDDEHDDGGGVGVGGGDFVLCKLFRSPHNHNEVAVPALLFNCKRKAVSDHTEAPPGVRQQLVQHSF